jgi:MOSC domain-containing protein YiiM
MADSTVGRVLAIAVRGPKTGPMRELERVALHVEGGLAGDAPATSVRGITLLASRQWRQVQEELGVELPWHTRRANVLIEADSLAHLMKKSVRLGPVPVRIHAETKPCGLMDELHPGLRAALTPDCRAGVYGTIEADGEIAIGDALVLAE